MSAKYVQIGEQKVDNKRIDIMRDSTDALNSEKFKVLGERMSQEGYLYFRGFVEKGELLNLRRTACEQLRKDGMSDTDDGRIKTKQLIIPFNPYFIHDRTVKHIMKHIKNNQYTRILH